ncbi:XdhC family protein [Frankia sp. AiPs1]|uniref:XdhC family protein n=1 Tax=Frankia sp. AiPs1 TaxID=573493 RepID=UPI0020437799|nr:XdhC/CoxI family protein [Frankia sp. AiPs1]MCM3923683.1 XdhC family protein [Frankia sp. AiPs1]
MRDIADALRRWRAAGAAFAVATVVEVRGSAPRQPGAAMAVAASGEVVGSVSGGCVEGAVYEAAVEAIRTGVPALESYGISDDDAFAVGLTCGGIIDLVIVPYPARRPFAAAEVNVDPPAQMDPRVHAEADEQRRQRRAGDALDAVLAALATDDTVALVTVVGGGGLGSQVAVWPDRTMGSSGVAGLDVAAVDDARGLLAAGRSGLRRYGPRGQRRPDAIGVFVQSFAPPPRMLVFGAIDYAAAMVRLGRFLGYRVTVCDARPVFATARRFPDADEVVCERPVAFLARAAVDARTVICVLTHDPKFDIPVLCAALRSPAHYVGAMGSRRTHVDRLRRLRASGVAEDALARLHSPIGLDLGSRTPEETAISIAAEIIQSRWGGSGRPLRATDGRIHADHGEPPNPSESSESSERVEWVEPLADLVADPRGRAEGAGRQDG